MVLMTRFSGQQWQCRYRKQTCGHGLGVGKKSGADGGSSRETSTLPYVKPMGVCYMTQGTQTRAL